MAAANRVVTVLALLVLTSGCIPRTPSGSPTPGSPTPGATTSSGSAVPSPAATAVTPEPAVPTGIPLPAADTERLRIGLDRDPSSIDPAAVTDAAGRMVVDALFDSLTRMSADLSEVLPAAASSWASSEDGLVWTFEVAPATWHDGFPVRAQQFVRGFNHVAAADGQVFNAPLLSAIDGWTRTRRTGAPLAGVEAVDDDTLRVTLQRPMADLPALLSHPALAPRRRGDLDQSRPVGNGSFRMSDDWAHNQFIRVARDVEHHRPARLDEVVFVIYAQSGSDVLQYDDFRRGVLDVAAVPAEELPTARGRHGRADGGWAGPGVLDATADEVYYFGYNVSSPPFDDADVRMAVSQLLDRDRVVGEFTSDSRTPAIGLVPPSFPGGGVVGCLPCIHEPQPSRGVLGALGSAVDDPIRILTLDGTTNRQVASELAEALQAVTDVQVVVEARPAQEWVQRLEAADLQVFRAGWVATWPAMGGMIEPLFHSRHLGGSNLVRIDDPGLDGMIDEAMQGGEGSLEQWQEIEDEVLDRALVAPVYWYQLNRVVSEAVENFAMAPTGAVDLAAVDVQRE